jgi:2-polyprenyl-3-methyl-5-hydroxy-6-metoxy-1,4-benzoquinol methylase
MTPMARVAPVAEAPPVAVGMFDFPEYTELVDALSEVLALPSEEVHERLFQEAVTTGWNVNRAAHRLRVTPHVFDDKMEALYKTDAFVFELVVVHLNAYCCEVDRRVSDAIFAQYGSRAGLRVLTFGDGIGTDALRFSRGGHDVTYCEFEGPSSRFAQYRFQRAGCQQKIRVIHDVGAVPNGAFDIVICREVLEHVTDPMSVISQLYDFLDREGAAIITESFNRVETAFPTHLGTNAKYAGRTEELFTNVGFHLRKSYPEMRPMVFQRIENSKHSRLKPSQMKAVQEQRRRVVQDAIRRAGRSLLRLVPF